MIDRRKAHLVLFSMYNVFVFILSQILFHSSSELMHKERPMHVEHPMHVRESSE